MSRAQAQADIAAGRVLVGGSIADKPARLVGAHEAVLVQGDGPRFVSRGGEKLDAALERFGIGVRGRRVLDAGASTGGFTDCVLQRGADSVVAVDVGYGQLHERLRGDARVTVRERVNLRTADPADHGGPFDLVVGDLSFISLRLVARPLLAACRPGGDLVLLVKPQFEAGRQEAARGRGVITDPVVWRRALDEVIAAFEAEGATMMGAMVSPIRGGDGNVEFLAHFVAAGRAGDVATVDLDAVVATAATGRD